MVGFKVNVVAINLLLSISPPNFVPNWLKSPGTVSLKVSSRSIQINKPLFIAKWPVKSGLNVSLSCG
jgi:hypothetical protein